MFSLTQDIIILRYNQYRNLLRKGRGMGIRSPRQSAITHLPWWSWPTGAQEDILAPRDVKSQGSEYIRTEGTCQALVIVALSSIQ